MKRQDCLWPKSQRKNVTYIILSICWSSVRSSFFSVWAIETCGPVMSRRLPEGSKWQRVNKEMGSGIINKYWDQTMRILICKHIFQIYAKLGLGQGCSSSSLTFLDSDPRKPDSQNPIISNVYRPRIWPNLNFLLVAIFRASGDISPILSFFYQTIISTEI